MTPITTDTSNRADAQIFAAVRRALDCNPMVPASVRVHVDRGMVVLTGSVRAASERDAAEQTARSIGGVGGVANDIFVHSTAPFSGFEPPER